MDTQVDVLDVEHLPPDPHPTAGSTADLVLVCPGYDHAIRWHPGERLEHLFEAQCDRLREGGRAGHPAVDAGEVTLTYDRLDTLANQLARHLLDQGARPGDRIGLLFDQPVHSYVGMLAVLKIHAAYVPLDAGFPDDRLSYIVRDAGVRAVLSLSHLAGRIRPVDATVLCVDSSRERIEAQPGGRLTGAERGGPVDDLCYIIYTSGSTGRPKGVAINHSSICNFVRVAAEVYGIVPDDRVYQGMTIAFDFSVEETWVPWMAGATLVPRPGGGSLLGPDLWDFLHDRDVTAVCCVPTLLATLDEDLPRLRFLLVSGEACPQDLITRWHRPGRRFLNVYGPTEATVTATWSVVHPDRPVTLGVPLPTYSTVVLDPEEDRALPHGELGELGIAGVGLATGYVNRADLTAKAFIPDFLALDANPSGRIYRTGDLCRVNSSGEIEYHGRIDTQIKIRGYRVELAEIESVLLQVPGIAAAVVGAYEPEPGTVELVAYYTVRKDAGEMRGEDIAGQLRGRLPAYMVPSYFERLPAIPMLPSDKADRKSLPAPQARLGLTRDQGYAAPATPVEEALAEELARTVRVDRVSADSDFFADLGANSLLMAQFCARVRRRAGLPPVSMRDVYLHPTIRSLAAALPAAVPAQTRRPPRPAAPVPRTANLRYVLCGLLQFALILGSAYLGSVVAVFCLTWVLGAQGLLDVYLRSVEVIVGGFAVSSTLPILGKWLIMGRWKAREIPVWSLAYVRFWYVRSLIRANPLVLFVGTPIYPLYLRALGAKIGRRVAIFSPTVPVCTDLLTIGDGTVIRKDSAFSGYRAHAGLIQTGPITLGRDVVVGEQTVLDIGASIGDGGRLGHSSTLHAGQAVPPGESWHGCPAQPAELGVLVAPSARCGTVRRVGYSVLKLLNMFLLTGPILAGFLIVLLTGLPFLSRVVDAGPPVFTGLTFYRDQLLLSLGLFVFGSLAGLAVVLTVPRLLQRAVRADRVYPLYGIRHWIMKAIGAMTNVTFYMRLFGDSSYIVNYLRAIGYDLSTVVQTGSNFGMQLKHDNPFLTKVGTGTMVSDGLSIINADFSNSSVRVSRVSIGAGSFLGNNVAYPAGGKVGDDCLIATKARIPLGGEVRQGVGLLGSPSFPIPRAAAPGRCASASAALAPDPAELPRLLAAKNRYNIATMGLFLAVRWLHAFILLVIGMIALDLLYQYGAWGFTAAGMAVLVFNLAFTVIVERAVCGFRALSPQFCSIYDPYYWWHERLWKLEASVGFAGTPLRGVMWRLLGVRVGRRLFDDGCYIPEKSLVAIGDDCTLNSSSVIQCHSQEDGVFKSDHTTIGDGCTLGVGAFVHYGVSVGTGAVLDPHSFLMKGEQVAPYAHWHGNPARQAPEIAPAPAPAARRPAEAPAEMSEHGGSEPVPAQERGSGPAAGPTRLATRKPKTSRSRRRTSCRRKRKARLRR